MSRFWLLLSEAVVLVVGGLFDSWWPGMNVLTWSIVLVVLLILLGIATYMDLRERRKNAENQLYRSWEEYTRDLARRSDMRRFWLLWSALNGSFRDLIFSLLCSIINGIETRSQSWHTKHPESTTEQECPSWRSCVNSPTTKPPRNGLRMSGGAASPVARTADRRMYKSVRSIRECRIAVGKRSAPGCSASRPVRSWNHPNWATRHGRLPSTF